MTLGGYTYQIGDLFTTSKTGVTGRIEKFVPQSKNVTRVMLRLANGQQRFAMVKTYQNCKNHTHGYQFHIHGSNIPEHELKLLATF